MVEWAQLIGLSVIHNGQNGTHLHRKIVTILENLYGTKHDSRTASQTSSNSSKDCSKKTASLRINTATTAHKDKTGSTKSSTNSTDSCKKNNAMNLGKTVTAHPSESGCSSQGFDTDNSDCFALNGSDSDCGSSIYFGSSRVRSIWSKSSDEQDIVLEEVPEEVAGTYSKKKRSLKSTVRAISTPSITSSAFDNSVRPIKRLKLKLKPELGQMIANKSRHKLKSLTANKRKSWSALEDQSLLKGLLKTSSATKNRWALIKKFEFKESERSSGNIKDRVRTLLKNNAIDIALYDVKLI